MRTSYILKKIKLSSSLQIRWFSSQAIVKLNDNIESAIAEEKIKPRNHPGIIKRKIINLPPWIIQAMNERFDDVNQTGIFNECKQFANYLFSRRLPLEKHELNQKYLKCEEQFLKNKINETSTIEEIEEMRRMIKGQVNYKVKQSVFAWKPLDYNLYRSLLYMITRSAAEYSVLYRIFEEIRLRDPEFNPSTMFDFGSGVGSVLWAANENWKNINEYLGIDISNDMLNLSEAIMNYSPKKVSALLHRQYFPVSNLKHELIVSAYSLMELHDAKNRLDVISKLWRKTSKYLVIVEQGTNAGFKVVNEARHFVQHMTKRIDDKLDYFTFAPCPHELSCPRFAEGKTPCNFLVQYQSLPLLGPSKPENELYCYVVLKKDKPTKDDEWHRVVRPTLIRKKHVICSLCTSNGELKEIVFTPNKYGKPLYRCTKASGWGDRLPINEKSCNDGSNNCEEQELNSNVPEVNENYESLETELDKEKEEKIFHSAAPFSTKSNENL